MNNELYHYGVKGMKWGVIKPTSGKRHIGIDSKGNLSITKEPTTKTNVKKFAIKSSIFASTVAASVYISKHPEVIQRGMKTADKFLNKNKRKTVKQAADTFSCYQVYSHKLGRMLTADEMIAKSLM